MDNEQRIDWFKTHFSHLDEADNIDVLNFENASEFLGPIDSLHFEDGELCYFRSVPYSSRYIERRPTRLIVAFEDGENALTGVFRLNDTVTPNSLPVLEDDFCFFHEFGHAVMDIIKNKVPAPKGFCNRDRLQYKLLGECEADAFAALMLLKFCDEEGLAEGFITFVSNLRALDMPHDAESFTTFTLDSVLEWASDSKNAEHLKEQTPEQLVLVAQTIASQNRFFAEIDTDVKVDLQNGWGDGAATAVEVVTYGLKEHAESYRKFLEGGISKPDKIDLRTVKRIEQAQEFFGPNFQTSFASTNSL